MDFRFLASFLAASFLSLGACGPAHAVLVEILFETDLSQTAVDLDNGPTLDTLSSITPLTANVAEDPDGLLTISVIGASSFDPSNSNVNASGAGLGINSPTPDGGSENSSRFDVDASESLMLTFNYDVNILSVDLTSLSGTDAFTFGSVTGINDANTPTNDVWTFAGGGMLLSAGTGVLLEATGPAGTSVGLQAITLEYVAVPEPSTLVALLGLTAWFASKRRHQAA